MSWNPESELLLKKGKFEPNSLAHVSDTTYIFLIVKAIKVARLLILGNNDVLHILIEGVYDLNWQSVFNWRKWN